MSGLQEPLSPYGWLRERRVDMEGAYSGGWTPELNAALSLRKRENGGALIAAGAAAWLVHSILMILGLVAMFSISFTDVTAASQAIFASLTVFIAATIAVLLATFLLGVGFLLYQEGTFGLTFHEWWSGVIHQVSSSTRTKGKVAAVFVILYGILGIVVVAIYATLLNSVSTVNPAAILSEVQTILALWLVASIFLVVGAVFVASFFNALRVETATFESFGGTGFVAYSISAAVGAFLVVGPLFAVMSNPRSAQVGLAVPMMIGGVIGLLVVPIMGIVVFSLMIGHGLRLRRMQAGPRPGSGSYPPGTPMNGPYVGSPPANGMYGAPKVVSDVLDAKSFPPPSMAEDFGTPPSEPLPDPAARALSDTSWALRMEAAIHRMERALKEDREYIFQLERSSCRGPDRQRDVLGCRPEKTGADCEREKARCHLRS
jgi:hypothetical protein